jgi:hypothetical protein
MNGRTEGARKWSEPIRPDRVAASGTQAAFKGDALLAPVLTLSPIFPGTDLEIPATQTSRWHVLS